MASRARLTRFYGRTDEALHEAHPRSHAERALTSADVFAYLDVRVKHLNAIGAGAWASRMAGGTIYVIDSSSLIAGWAEPDPPTTSAGLEASSRRSSVGTASLLRRR